MSEEELELGRALGGLKKSRPDVYAQLKQLSEKKKRKISEILTEALESYIMLEQLETIDPKQLMASMIFFEKMLNMAVKILTSTAQIFTTDLTQAILGMRLESEMPKSAPQSSQEQPAPATTPMTPHLAQLQATLMSTVANMLINLLNSLSKSGMGMSQPMIPITAPSTPASKPPVKIIK